MPCYHPHPAYRCADGSVVFVERKRHDTRYTLWLPCGQCIGCRLERSRQWAIRCVHEASQHKRNAFITLTYDDEHLPASRSLCYRDFQLFMKRLRKRFGKVRFYMCGEYGDQFDRPHFHACLFGVDFDDKLRYGGGASKAPLFRSAVLSSLWDKGFASVGEVNFESAAYCARYVMKKVNGDGQIKHYEFIDPATGEVHAREPEFCHMSLKPGIGAVWLDKFASDVYPHGMVVSKSVEVRPPSYYDRWFKEKFPDEYEEMVYRREVYAKERPGEYLDDRLAVREAVTAARVSQLNRSL